MYADVKVGLGSGPSPALLATCTTSGCAIGYQWYKYSLMKGLFQSISIPKTSNNLLNHTGYTYHLVPSKQHHSHVQAIPSSAGPLRPSSNLLQS